MKPISSVEEEIFYRALEILDADNREHYLRQACDSESLRRSVDALLSLHEKGSRLFQQAAAGFSLDSEVLGKILDDTESAEDVLESRIGPYRLVQKIGEGGGGVVYEAEQETPVHRMVALKILKRSMCNRRVLNRFQAERQALELMSHPNIAMVLDAGETTDGRPYFVIELVRGMKITDHCAKHAVSLPTRLKLMQQVCSAIQHAHQKGIIHCDLKPSNILITIVDGVMIPKVIDFGIAKAAAGDGFEAAHHAHPVGTPAYMSPEQISGSKDIDTRSDIYSLGVILYELIAGRPLFAEDATTTTHACDIRGQLLRKKTLTPLRQASRNGATTFRWNKDLEWIVMMAIEKYRECRYATVRGLSQDIARYLSNEPVVAHPSSRIYRLRKFVRRNRLASAAILGLAIGFTTSTIMYVRAEHAERKQAQLRAEAEERECVTKAAILLMQDKPAEADAEIQKMAGILTQPSVEATSVFLKLAIWNALQGDWKSASNRLLALSRVNRFDDSDMSDNATRDLVPLPPTLIEAGNVTALEQFESMLTERLGHTKNPIAAEEILKMCLLLPPSDEILKRLEPIAAVAEDSLSNLDTEKPNWLRAWRYMSLGLWYYRTGNYEQSFHALDVALTSRRNTPAMYACCYAVRSMAFRKIGQNDEADEDVAFAKSMIDVKFSLPMAFDNGGLWHDWLAARILLREAGGR
jgi:eukaryotic-like serine/threonine-protein kinase